MTWPSARRGLSSRLKANKEVHWRSWAQGLNKLRGLNRLSSQDSIRGDHSLNLIRSQNRSSPLELRNSLYNGATASLKSLRWTRRSDRRIRNQTCHRTPRHSLSAGRPQSPPSSQPLARRLFKSFPWRRLNSPWWRKFYDKIPLWSRLGFQFVCKMCRELKLSLHSTSNRSL